MSSSSALLTDSLWSMLVGVVVEDMGGGASAEEGLAATATAVDTASECRQTEHFTCGFCIRFRGKRGETCCNKVFT